MGAKQAAVGLLGSLGGTGLGGLLGLGGGVGGVVKETIPLLGFGGGRAGGGGVTGDSFYEVGEGGRPELFQQNGRTYLIPGNDGQVVAAAPSVTLNDSRDGATCRSCRAEIVSYSGPVRIS